MLHPGPPTNLRSPFSVILFLVFYKTSNNRCFIFKCLINKIIKETIHTGSGNFETLFPGCHGHLSGDLEETKLDCVITDG